MRRFHLAYNQAALSNCGTFNAMDVGPGSPLQGEFRFQTVLEGWFPGDCQKLRPGPLPVNEFLKFLSELGFSDDLRRQVIATLRAEGKARVETKNYGEIRLQAL